MAHPLLSAKAGDSLLLLGNEAIVRGALEAGIDMVTCYPGTPSSEAPDTFFRLSPDADFQFEYSVNEKVALEVGGGATLAGALTLVTMKHVGVNVAADPLMTLTYIGAPGGLVLLSADDPGCHSSQNEQDNRYYARLAGMPIFEPATAQEAKDMTRDALLYSRKWKQPVMLRTTTRLNHLRGVVELGPVPGRQEVEGFVKTPLRYVPIPAVARNRHAALLDIMAEIDAEMAATPWNRAWGQGETGIIVSGISRAYITDLMAEPEFIDRFRVLELGFSYPLHEASIEKFLREGKRVVIVEEGEPVVETEVRALAQRLGIEVEIIGKNTEGLSRLGEYSTATLRPVLDRLLDGGASTTPACATPEQGLPNRPPNLCPGCPHRGTYYAVRQLFGDNAVFSTDIGCYTLGILPPLSAADLLLCMGSSITAGTGVSRASGQPAIAFIGDSTFFHSGVTGIINAVFNDHDILVIVVDNATTAMTGHQPHPGVEISAIGPNENRVDIEAIVRGCGVEHIEVVNPLNFRKTTAALEKLRDTPGVRVLIAREPCPLHAKRSMGKKYPKVATITEQSESVRACLEQLACPAFELHESEVAINETMCSGCMLCLQLSPEIKAKDRG
jgi:indolepyruvate ferredoxin oxidoreductase alpha subunit